MAIPPLGPNANPASSASRTSGRTPMAPTTRSAAMTRPSLRTTDDSDRRNGRSRCDVDAMGSQLIADQNGKLWVERREYLRSRFDDGHVNPLSDEVLRHFQTD